MITKHEKLAGKAQTLQSAYLGFRFRGDRIADAKTQKRSTFRKSRDRVLRLWNGATVEERALAQLLIINQSFERPPFAINGKRLQSEMIDRQTAIAFLSGIQDWVSCTPDEAEGIATEIIQDLARAGLDIEGIAEEQVISALPIETKMEAHAVSQKLLSLSHAGDSETVLSKGLLKALHGWTGKITEAAMTAAEVISTRQELNISQIEMAARIDISPRQYIRYEMGETRISDKMAKRIKAAT